MLRNSAKVFSPGYWTGLWEMGARLRRPGLCRLGIVERGV